MRKKLGLIPFVIVCSLMISIEKGYSHGLGLETIRTASIDGRQLTLTAQISPTEFTPGKKNIIVRLADSFTDQNINNVTFIIGLYHKNELIFKDRFFASNGMVIINVNPVTDGQTQIKGEKNEELDAWYGTETTPIELVGPIFDSGGLYHFEIEIETINEPTNFIGDSKVYAADITLVTRQLYEEKYKNGNGVTFGIISYYDEISNFDYEPESNLIHFEMPFDWSERNILHIPVVHEEVHFPKDFEEFFAPSYVGKVNGIELFKSAVTVDDYSREDERIVHFVISQDTLSFLKQQQKASGVENPQGMEFTLETSGKVVFPIIAMTKNEEIQVDLSWDPFPIEPNKNTKFIYTFRDAKTGETLRNTNYDFIILQNEKELYKKSGNARVGGDFADYTFLEGQTGQATIRFENIRGKDLSTEFVITVIPEFGDLVLMIFPAAIAAMLIMGRRFKI